MFRRASIVIFSLALFATPVFSQTLPNPSPQSETDLQTLISDYFFQLDKYRDARDTYNFERAEFQKLGTLASQEDALSALKVLMTARAKTQFSYFAILDNLVLNSNSIDLEVKQTALDKLEEQQAFITNHLSVIPNVADKDDVLTESLRFEENAPQISLALYRSLTLISTSRIQNALDQTIVAANDFEEDFVNKIEDEDFRAANQRGLKEVAALLNDSNKSMDKVALLFSGYDSDDRRTKPSTIHNNIVREMNNTHSNLKRAVTFLIELERGL